jgi:catechol 2,3-dioxygenase-like lactoylglutathione lyase family enzyme
MTLARPSIHLIRSEPILPVPDVVTTVRYYRSVLGFSDEWLWGDPTDFGGVRWGRIGLMFDQQAGLSERVQGLAHAIFVEGIDSLHELHQRNGAEVVFPLEMKGWGLREYTVRDLNGYLLRFGESGSIRTSRSSATLPRVITLIERRPSIDEYVQLIHAVDWSGFTNLNTASAALA